MHFRTLEISEKDGDIALFYRSKLAKVQSHEYGFLPLCVTIAARPPLIIVSPSHDAKCKCWK